jgi:hypothetical protein
VALRPQKIVQWMCHAVEEDSNRPFLNFAVGSFANPRPKGGNHDLVFNQLWDGLQVSAKQAELFANPIHRDFLLIWR